MTAPATIEQMLLQLEQHVKNIEEGTMPFEESLTTYKEGLALAQQCKQYLEKSKEEIKDLHDQYFTESE